MAITNITSGATDFNPVYNPLVYMFESTNVSQPGFRYVVDIYSAGTSTKIYEGRLAPRPSDNYGYIDVSKIIGDFVTYDVNVTGTTHIVCPNSFYNYDLKVGEEYQVSWPFDDTFFSTGGITLLTGSTTHTFVTGDQVVISQDTDYIPALEGLQVVFSATSSTSFQVDVAHISSPANTGTVKYADGRKTIFRDLYNYSAQTAYNAAFGSSEWIDYNSANYQITETGTTNCLLTNLPDNFKATEEQDLFVNLGIDNASVYSNKMVFVNSNGDILCKDIAASLSEIKQVAVGPNNSGTLTVSSGTLPLIKSDTEYYDFYVTDTLLNQSSKKYRVYIDRRCGIEDYEILFQDRKGSFMSYNFPLRANTNISGNKFSYNQQIGDIKNGKWNYDRTDTGKITSNIDINEDIIIRTNYVTNEMGVYFEELIFSPVTFVKIDGVYFSCEIITKNYSPQSLKLNKPNSLTARIRLSNQDNINI
jgi:hypothetical protein